MIIGVKVGNEWRLVDFMRPSTEALAGLTYSDVSCRLFNMKRFCGSGYSVMKHSHIVASMVPRCLRDAALMHDCVEIMTGDIPSPFKRFMRVGHDWRWFTDLEDEWQMCFFEALGIPWPSVEDQELIHQADKEAGRQEALAIGLRFDHNGRAI